LCRCAHVLPKTVTVVVNANQITHQLIVLTFLFTLYSKEENSHSLTKKKIGEARASNSSVLEAEMRASTSTPGSIQSSDASSASGAVLARGRVPSQRQVLKMVPEDLKCELEVHGLGGGTMGALAELFVQLPAPSEISPSSDFAENEFSVDQRFSESPSHITSLGRGTSLVSSDLCCKHGSMRTKCQFPWTSYFTFDVHCKQYE
jgi:hypothetical protein